MLPGIAPGILVPSQISKQMGLGMLQVREEIIRRGIPQPGILGQGLGDDVVQIIGNIRIIPAGGRGGGFQMHPGHFQRRIPVIGQFPGEHLEQHHPQGIQIRLGSHRLTGRLFR